MSATADTKLYLPQGPFIDPGHGPTGMSQYTDRTTERRVVTILFCDVAGSTAMAEVLDPEEWAEVMNEAFEYLIRPIEHYDGTVARLMGDAVLALFGAPRAHEDDPQRAILAALEIVESIQPLRERIKRRYGLDFNVRAGINTGLVVVGAFGADELVEYTAMGDAINVAARLEQMADPGTIRVGATTHRLAAPFFDFESFGESSVRGKREPEITYRVIGRKQTIGRLWDVNGRDMPFTGRSREMERIRQAIDELRFEGRGRIITISGEAGIGKTRIVDEVIRYVNSQPDDDGGLSIALLENRVNPYEGTRPYAGLQARFRKVFGIEPDDSSQVVRDKFIERSKQFPQEFRERAARVIQRVMALDITGPPGSEDAGFEPDEFKIELSAVVQQIVRGWNPEGAFMLVGEDYQWGDAASLEIVSHLYELLDERPVLFLATFRPDPEAPFTRILESVRERHAQHLLEIELAPLPTTDAGALVRALIAGDTQAAEGLRRIILERSEGNPLFIEEIVQALAEQGALERLDGGTARWQLSNSASSLQLSIPTSLQALLLERIDRLPPDARRTLQQAAVLGRSFSRRVLREIAQINGDLNTHLDTLMRLDMIRVSGSDSDESLAFRHALIQEAAYDTILLRHRREFHRRAGETIERLYSDRQSEFAGDIGTHFYLARDERAVPWLVRAAEQAQSVYEPELVIEYSTKALELAQSTGVPAPARAHHLRGRANDMTGNFEGARRDLETVIDASVAHDDRDLEWQALVDLSVLWSEADYGQAGVFVRRALDLARQLGDDRKIAHSLNRVGNWHINIGEPQNARSAHDEALAIFQRLDDTRGLAETLDLIGLASYLSSDFARGAASFRESIRAFRELGDNRGLSSSLAMLALSGGGIDTETALPAPGDLEEWATCAQEALDIARSIGWSAGEAFATFVLGEVHVAFGEPGKGIELIRSALGIAQAIDHKQWSLAAIQALGTYALEFFHYERACEYLTEALARAKVLGSAYWTGSATAGLVDWQLAHGNLDAAEALLLGIIDPDSHLDSVGQRKLWYRWAKLALARGDAEKALRIVDDLISTAPGSEPDGAIPGLSLVRGQALMRLGMIEPALAQLHAGSERARRSSDPSMRLRLHVALADAYRSAGHPEREKGERDSARRIVDQISETLFDEDWRASFAAGANGILTR